MDRARLDDVLARAFDGQPTDELAETLAVVVVRHGEVVVERYGPGVDAGTTLISWSMAKSWVHALVGFAVADGRLDHRAPAPVPEWSSPGDPRRAVTVEHLLRMCSGLAFREDYVDEQVSDVITMLFGAGRDDVAAFAAGFPLEHPPGAVFNYSSGTSNVLARIVGDCYGGQPGVEALFQERLLGPLGMDRAAPRFDAAGTFVGSSFVDATAREFARFGELYLAGGRWGGEQLLPAAWVADARVQTPLPTRDDGQRYGAHWWLFDEIDGVDAFAAQGYDGQRTLVVPDWDLVAVRLGRTPAELKANLRAWLAELVVAVGPG